jgi:hypothetical protein
MHISNELIKDGFQDVVLDLKKGEKVNHYSKEWISKLDARRIHLQEPKLL